MTGIKISNFDIVYSVLVHYTNLSDTIECIESLQKQDYINHQIVLVDNGSQYHDSQTIQRLFPQIICLRNKSNLGFTGGYNTGIRFSLKLNPDYVFILNNDVILKSDVIKILVKAFQAKREVGIVSPIIYYYDEPDQIWSAGGKVNKITLNMVDNHGRHKSFSEIVERDFISGCAVMFKKEVLEKVGLFDEDYFSYYEDYDISFRIKKAGYKQLLVPQAKIWHKVSKSSGGKDNTLERYYMARNSILFFLKHAKLWQFPIIIPYRIGSAIRTLSRLLMEKKFNSARYYLLGMIDGIRRNKTSNLI